MVPAPSWASARRSRASPPVASAAAALPQHRHRRGPRGHDPRDAPPMIAWPSEDSIVCSSLSESSAASSIPVRTSGASSLVPRERQLHLPRVIELVTQGEGRRGSPPREASRGDRDLRFLLLGAQSSPTAPRKSLPVRASTDMATAVPAAEVPLGRAACSRSRRALAPPGPSRSATISMSSGRAIRMSSQSFRPRSSAEPHVPSGAPTSARGWPARSPPTSPARARRRGTRRAGTPPSRGLPTGSPRRSAPRPRPPSRGAHAARDRPCGPPSSRRAPSASASCRAAGDDQRRPHVPAPALDAELLAGALGVHEPPASDPHRLLDVTVVTFTEKPRVPARSPRRGRGARVLHPVLLGALQGTQHRLLRPLHDRRQLLRDVR